MFRDDSEFVLELRDLFLCWKMGQVPDGTSIDSMPEEQAAQLTVLIRTWEQYARTQDYKMLSRIIGGGGKDGS